MPIRTPRMEQIEALLADDPTDPFLRYGLAMEYVSAGDDATAADHLVRLANDASYVPAFLQAGQVLARLNRVEEACDALRRGVAAARQQGDAHAEGEMAGLLASLE
jgi:Tfp pilus assembly protein PilF